MPKKRTIRIQGLRGKIRTKYPLFANKEIKSEIAMSNPANRKAKDLRKTLILKNVKYVD